MPHVKTRLILVKKMSSYDIIEQVLGILDLDLDLDFI